MIKQFDSSEKVFLRACSLNKLIKWIANDKVNSQTGSNDNIEPNTKLILRRGRMTT